ncbi:MAG: Multidrug resistance protein MdtA precursor [Pseudomonadota bacterium]|jgi:RND family efflux transporter MFP subunit
MNFKSRTHQFIALFLLLSLGGGVLYWQKMHAKAPSAKEAFVKVFQASEVTQPQLQLLTGRIEMSGVLVASETATLRSKTAGTLLRLNVAEGQAVQKGQVLAEVDARDLSSRTDEREAALNSAQRAYQLALSQHKANQDLARQGFISETAMASTQANLAASLALLKAAEAAAISHSKQVTDAAITAPFSGVVARRLTNVGEKISTEQEVLQVVNPSRMEFKALVDASASQFLKPGLRIPVQFEGVGQVVTLRLDRIGPGNDPGSRALPVYLSLEPTSSLQMLRPGLMGMAQYAYALSQEGLTLPITAVQDEGGKSIVWVIQEGVIKRQTVTLGMKDSQGQRVYILDGLNASNIVLALRFEGMKEGTKVEVKR